MPDTIRPHSEILALLADNTTGDISPQDIRDAYVTLRDELVKATPAAFTFTDLTDVNLGSVNTHDSFTITGVNVPVIARATGSLMFSVNGGDFVTEAVAQADDEIVAKMTASPANLTEVTGTLNIGGVSDTWSITTGNFWTPDTAAEEAVVWGFYQEDLEEGPVTAWQSRGVKPKTANGNATKLADNGGVFFAKGTSQVLQWGADTVAPWLHRTWVVILRADVDGNPSVTGTALSVHATTGQNPFGRHPNIKIQSGKLQSHLGMAGHSIQDADAELDFGDWNIVVAGVRGTQHWARINGEEQTPLEYISMAPPNAGQPSWLGGGPGATPGSVSMDMAIDCAIMLQAEPSDDLIDKLEGWAAWRVGRADLLPAQHPYKEAAPTPDGSEGVPTRYIHNALDFADWNDGPIDKTRFGDAAPTPDATYSRVFFEDCLTNPMVSGVTGDPTASFFVNTDTGNVGKDATIVELGNDPECYLHDGTAPGWVTIRLQHDGSKWVSGTLRTTNENGQGRTWRKGRFITKIRFMGISPFGGEIDFPWPGFFPAWWCYNRDHEFWRTRNSLEYDWFEHEGASVEDDRIATAFHIHPPSIPFSTDPEEILQGSEAVGIVHDSDLQTSNGWPEDTHFYDEDWHTYEIRIEDDFIYNIVNGFEIGRRPTTAGDFDGFLDLKYFIWDFALRLNQGEDPTGQGPWDMDIDSFEVWMKEADLAVVPDGFSARPTLSGTRGNGNTITVTPNTTASQIEYRWYKDGEPIVGEEGATFVEDADSATKALRVHVRAVSLLDQPEAWTAELEV